MKLKEYLKQFEGLDPEIEVYKHRVVEKDPPQKEFSTAYIRKSGFDIETENLIIYIVV